MWYPNYLRQGYVLPDVSLFIHLFIFLLATSHNDYYSDRLKI